MKPCTGTTIPIFKKKITSRSFLHGHGKYFLSELSEKGKLVRQKQCPR